MFFKNRVIFTPFEISEIVNSGASLIKKFSEKIFKPGKDGSSLEEALPISRGAKEPSHGNRRDPVRRS